MADSETQKPITLKGSVSIVKEFFAYAVNSILFQRGIYPSEFFEVKKKYGLPMMVTTDPGLRTYVSQILKFVEKWLGSKDIQKLIMVVQSVETKEIVERWAFNINLVKQAGENAGEGAGENSNPNPNNKQTGTSEAQICKEIREMMKQICASVTFLPLLEEECTFDILVYTNVDTAVPTQWETSDPRYIDNPEHVKFRSFSTSVHKVEPIVAYREQGMMDY